MKETDSLEYHNPVQAVEKEGPLLLQKENDSLTASPSYTKAQSLKNLGIQSNESSVLDSFLKPNEIETEPSNNKIYLKIWNPKHRLSARLIEFYDDVVKLECLIDKENSIYEEKEFSKNLFNELEIKINNLFFIKLFERIGEAKIEIIFDRNNTFKDDFPRLDFVEAFKDSKLFKKKA